MIKYVPIPIKDTLQKDQKRTYLMMIMRFFFSDFLYKGICCGYSFELHRQVDAIQMRTHNICLYKKVNKKYTGCNKTTEFHECALIGVCAVIRSNTVLQFLMKTYSSEECVCCFEPVTNLSKLSIPLCHAMFHESLSISKGRPVCKGFGSGTGATWLGLLS